MMISTKPLSSPGRTEKFQPPPLARFLRSNAGGRSFKGNNKSRSSPLFILRKRNNANNAVDNNTHEPSSPKVTCIGQVRPHKPPTPSVIPTRPDKKTHTRCLWPKDCKAPAWLCPHFLKQIKPKSFSFCSGFGKWVMSCRVGWCGKFTDRTEENRGKRMEDRSGEEEEGEGRLEAYEGLELDSSVAVQPPRNAFMLTRCRSSSYRGNETEDQSVEKEEVEEGLESCGSEGFDSSSATVQPPPMNAFLLTRCKSSSHRGNQMDKVEVRFGSSEGLDSKNAFLLTRCRSAPYRSSSLATRLLGSVAEKVEEERETEGGNGGEEAGEELETEGTIAAVVEPDRDSESESRIGGEERPETTADEEIKAVGVVETTAEMMLTRCKSEPARGGERLTAVARFCRDTEGSALTC